MLFRRKRRAATCSNINYNASTVFPFMDLHLKHRNGIVVEIAERNFHGNKKAICSSPPPISYNTQLPYAPPLPLSSSFRLKGKEKKEIRASLLSYSRRRIRFASNRAKVDQRSRLSLS